MLSFSAQRSRFTIRPEQVFMVSTLVVNGGNYLYNLMVGRMLGPAAFADAAVIITLLLVFSFIGMTFQICTTKYACQLGTEFKRDFIPWITRLSLICGLPLAAIIYFAAPQLQIFFQTSSDLMFRWLALGLPVYLYLSINRGVLQGRENFVGLALSYQGEMWTRLLLTIGLLMLFPDQYILIISAVVVLSLLAGVFPHRMGAPTLRGRLAPELQSTAMSFFLLTAFYELTQIAINNGDILLVKHFFGAEDAGMYAALALIGRIVYFITWMLAMVLLPKVIRKAQDGENTLPILTRYIVYSAVLGLGITSACAIAPEFLVELLFGHAYIAIAPLLWKYAIATTLFAISNIFVYYFLALKQYVPIALSALFAMLQLVAICLLHGSLEEVVLVQIAVMLLMNISLWVYFFSRMGKPAKDLID